MKLHSKEVLPVVYFHYDELLEVVVCLRLPAMGAFSALKAIFGINDYILGK